MTRRIPKPSDIKPYLRVRVPERRGEARRLAKSQAMVDVERLAKRRVPRSVWEFVTGAAEDEVSLAENRRELDDVRFTPRAFGQVARPDTSTVILGRPAPLPLILAPTGFTRLSHHEGENAVARAGRDANIPYCLSTFATTSIGEVGAAAAAGRNWFQVYLMRDREITLGHLAQARDAGYEALMLTVDTPVAGHRRRDFHNGFDIPPNLTPRALRDMAVNPRWVLDLLTLDPLRFATLTDAGDRRWTSTGAVVESNIRPADIAWLCENWGGPVIVKGLMNDADARDSVDAGAVAIVVSNHGGRQLDRTRAPLAVLPRIAEAVGDRAEIYVDSGFRTGSDIAAAVGLGARAVMIGRPYLFGLMMAGERGVRKVIDIYRAELRRTMTLLGTPTIGDIGPNHVSLSLAEVPLSR